MARPKHFEFVLFISTLLVFVFSPTNAQLKVGFYSKTCPQAEVIVKKVIDQVMSVAPSIGAPLLRMHFHDCFVRGCDGSILLNATNNQKAEKDAPPNLSIRGHGVINRVKSALEKSCPGIVSCSDIVAIVARDVTVALKGPFWQVETGRRDGNVSIASDTRSQPSPLHDISRLISSFRAKGLSIKDLVVLSGAHTIGTSHCSSFSSRLYSFTGNGDTDPNMDRNYIANLKLKCKPNDQTTLVEMDPGSFKTFDAGYYTNVAKRRGLFVSDSALLNNTQTRAYVLQSITKRSTFMKDFGVSMVKMGRIGVLTGSAGEIRKVCAKVN